ncbi:MAG: hypothetical protein ACW96S_14675, partial [Promethearchaeota archaeon]
VYVGNDRPGQIARFSKFASGYNANIHKLNMISRGQIIACESLLNISDLNITREEFVKGLRTLGKELELQIIVESEDVFKKKVRKLLILDLEENLIQIQGLTEFLNKIQLSDLDKEIVYELKTKKDYQAIKELGINSLKGMEIKMLNQLISSLKISPGTEEFIRALKLMQYTIALLSNSLSIFTDIIKNRLNLEYAFGNALEVREGKITGKYVKNLEIDPQKKEKLVNWLAVMEKVPEVEVIQFGLDNFEIGFDYERINNMIQQKQITVSQILGLFISIGMMDSQIEKIRELY